MGGSGGVSTLSIHLRGNVRTHAGGAIPPVPCAFLTFARSVVPFILRFQYRLLLRPPLLILVALPPSGLAAVNALVLSVAVFLVLDMMSPAMAPSSGAAQKPVEGPGDGLVGPGRGVGVVVLLAEGAPGLTSWHPRFPRSPFFERTRESTPSQSSQAGRRRLALRTLRNAQGRS